MRSWAFGFQDTPKTEAEIGVAPDADEPTHRNPPWSRNELILALDFYLRHRASLPGKESIEIAELSQTLGDLRHLPDIDNALNFRNANGVYMKMMNFRRFDPDYLAEGKIGLVRGNRLKRSSGLNLVTVLKL